MQALVNAVSVYNGQPVTTSEKVAEVFGKQHSHVLRSIQKLIELDERCKSIFGCTSVSVQMPNGGIREEAAFRMTRDGFALLVMGFTGKKALGFKLAYIEAFNAMESELRKQKSIQQIQMKQVDTRKKVIADFLDDVRLDVECGISVLLGLGFRMPNGFVSPDPEAVKLYCEFRHYTHVDAVQFVKYYNKRNWTRGRSCTPIDDWQDLVDAWERRRIRWMRAIPINATVN